MQQILDWIKYNKDALNIIFGSGITIFVFGAILRFVAWLMRARRKKHLRVDSTSFKVIPPNSNVAKEVLGGDDNDPLADRNIPYQQRIEGRNIRREIEESLDQSRYVLITGRTGLGKTREAVLVAESLNKEGWTVLHLTRAQWLAAPARLPSGIPERKLLFLLDDLNRKIYASRVEQSPKADEPLNPLTVPLQVRLQETLETYEALCGKSEIRVIATARNEKFSEFAGELGEWQKLEFDKYPGLWKRFSVYELPEPSDQAEVNLIEQSTKSADIKFVSTDLEAIADRNDGTFANLVENIRTAQNQNQEFSLNNFRDTLKGTWEKRYKQSIQKYSQSKYIYDSVDLLRTARLDLSKFNVFLTSKILAGGNILKRILNYWNIYVVLNHLIKTENILEPRDGQIEAKGYQLDVKPYLLSLYIPIWNQTNSSASIFARLDFYTDCLFFPEKLDFRRQISFFKKMSSFAFSTESGTLQGIGTSYLNMGYPEEGQFIPERSVELAKYDFLRNRKSKAMTWSNLGYGYYELEKYQDAIAAHQKAIELNPKFAYPWNGLGNIYYAQDRYDDAITAYQKAIELNPKYAVPWNRLGNIYYAQDRYDDAIAAYQKAIELNPKFAVPWIGLGNIYDAQDRYDDAIAAYQKAIELDPKSAALWNGLGNIYEAQDRYDHAIAAYQKAIELDPKSAIPWNRLGNIYEAQDRYDDAITAYQKATELDPKDAYPWVGLGYVYEAQDRYDDAIAAYQKAIELNPKYAASWNGLGNIYYAQDRYDDAIAAYQKAIELDPKYAYPWDNLGDIYRAQYQTDDAIAAYQKAIELDPKYAYPWNGMGYVYILLNRLDDALATIQKAAELAPDNGSIQSSLVGILRPLDHQAALEKQINITAPLMDKASEFVRARFASICGNVEESLTMLRVALEKKQISSTWAHNHLDFDFIRDDSRFKILFDENDTKETA